MSCVGRVAPVCTGVPEDFCGGDEFVAPSSEGLICLRIRPQFSRGVGPKANARSEDKGILEEALILRVGRTGIVGAREASSRLWVVTGAAGFLGNNVVRELLAKGESVRAAVYMGQEHAVQTPPAIPPSDKTFPALPPRADSVPPALVDLQDDENLEIVRIDVRDLASVQQAFTSSDLPVWVVHCAGIVSIAGKVTPLVEETNVGGTANVVAAARSTSVERLAYISSVHAMPEVDGVARELDHAEDFNPDAVHGEYAKTKAAATSIVLGATDLWRVVVFPSGMAGHHDFGDTHLTRLVRDAASGTLFISVKGGYDFADVRDIAEATIAAIEKGHSGRTYLLPGHY